MSRWQKVPDWYKLPDKIPYEERVFTMLRILLQDINACSALSDEIDAWVGKDRVVSRHSYTDQDNLIYKHRVVVDRNESYQKRKKQLEDWYKL
jgi:hypothetical protein